MPVGHMAQRICCSTFQLCGHVLATPSLFKNRKGLQKTIAAACGCGRRTTQAAVLAQLRNCARRHQILPVPCRLRPSTGFGYMDGPILLRFVMGPSALSHSSAPVPCEFSVVLLMFKLSQRLWLLISFTRADGHGLMTRPGGDSAWKPKTFAGAGLWTLPSS